jgi:Anti-sigma-K factor rskA
VSTPTLPTDHDEYEALAIAWSVNALEPADQAVFEAHRDGCERCARAAYAALDIAAELAYGVPDVAPPARLRERVLAAALPHDPSGQLSARPDQSDPVPAVRSASEGKTDRVEGLRTTRPVSDVEADRVEGRRDVGSASRGEVGRSGSRFGGGRESAGGAGRRPKGAGAGRVARAMRRPRRLAYALVAAVLVVGSAVTTWEVTRPAPVTDRIAALSAGGETIATVVAHQHGADVVTDMLAPNTGRGTAYYVWGVPAEEGGTPQVVGTFEVTAAGLHSYPLRLARSLDGYPMLAISEERAGSTPSTPSGVLGKGALGG